MTRPQDVSKDELRTVPGDLPDAFEPAEGAPDPSLFDDVAALFEDGKTYLEAELNFQKSRAGFLGNRLRRAGVLGLVAFGLLHLAGIALTVGLVIALSKLVGPWFATLIVVIVFVGIAALLLSRLRGLLSEIGSAFEDGQ